MFHPSNLLSENLGSIKKKGKYIPFYARASWAGCFPHRGPELAHSLSLSRRLDQAVLRASETGLLSDRSAL